VKVKVTPCGIPAKIGTMGCAEPQDARLKEIVRRLAVAYQPECIYLFGSHALSEANADSDFDLAVVLPDHAPADLRGSRIAYQVLRGTGTAADIVVFTRSSRQPSGRPILLPATVRREGTPNMRRSKSISSS
jgi:predicted nucleotidyltransferase